MRTALLLLALAVAAACGYDPCPAHTHEVDAGVCVTDCGFEPGPDGGAVPSPEACSDR